MDKFFKWKVVIIVLVVAFSIWKAYPPQDKINLGLDLQGGMQLLLEVDLEKIPEDARDDATDRVVEIIRNRIDEFGVREPVIAKQGSSQVIVQLPGVTDRDRAKDIVGKTAHLEFKLVSEDAALIKQAEEGTVPEGYEYKEMKGQMGTTSHLLLHAEASLTGEHLTTATVGFDQYGQPIVQLELDKDGAKAFDKLTFENIGRQLSIVLDGRVHSAPVIRDRIPNGQAQISGNFTAEEASDLALVLRAGALPAPVNVIEERTVGPSLGRDSTQKGVRAGIIGAILIFLFMPIYYFFAGFMANLGLVVYGIVVIGSLAAFQASLTLPGIAGFILSIGMAVDANVLIFERIREEHETGKTARASISAGFHKAFSAILDSNVTTLLTSLILFIFGTGPVKGFAVTLSIGIIASMFTALVVVRVLFDFSAKKNPNLKLNMLKLIGSTHIPFLKGRFFAYGFSVLTIIIGIAAFLMRGQENYGVEFTGGTFAQIQFQQSLEISKLRIMLDKEGERGAVIQRIGSEADSQFVIKSSAEDTAGIENVAREIAGEGGYKILKVDRIGPAVSLDLKKKAILAVCWASVGILIYLGWRFEWKFALAAVIAMLHDTIFTFGVYALSGREINLPIIAAILTIMGYSVNDTIVNFDRIRDNLKLMRRTPFEKIVDTSINQMLSRTILTTVTTLLAAFALFLFGGSSIQDFAFILLIGFAVGVYSSIFVASALVVDWKAH
ncbi:MAG: protein translocase subunit SecD [Candidatus Omnitrophica bacterium]|nr:protein translocase subunit SecD [Candidatus Omnitrophota bacterium]